MRTLSIALLTLGFMASANYWSGYYGRYIHQEGAYAIMLWLITFAGTAYTVYLTRENKDD